MRQNGYSNAKNCFPQGRIGQQGQILPQAGGGGILCSGNLHEQCPQGLVCRLLLVGKEFVKHVLESQDSGVSSLYVGQRFQHGALEGKSVCIRG